MAEPKDETRSISESENPAIPAPDPKEGGRPRANKDWWRDQIDLQVLNKPSRDSDPLGEDFNYA